MARDEALAHSAASLGVASLRFYRWVVPTLSLGYFQASASRLGDPRLAALPWVRRPSGGATLVHHHELTYALALPQGQPWQDGRSWMSRMHRIIAAGLSNLGINGVALVETPATLGDILCFQQQTPGDLLCQAGKVVGSAQRKYRGALVQHGSILLRQSEHTPTLPGLFELANATVTPELLQHEVCDEFSRATSWQLTPSEWTSQEAGDIKTLVRDKYRQPRWNAKR